MKLAFLYPENPFTSELLGRLKAQLPDDEIASWIAGESAPGKDIELLVAIGKVGPEELAGLDQLALIQTASTGFESVDIDAATELGIWVSFAPSGATGNATSVAEYAILLLLAASWRLGAFLKAEKDPSIHPPSIHPALSGKTVCIVGLGGVGEEVVKRLRPFDVTITGTDEHPENAPAGVTAYEPSKLKEIVAAADYVIVCVRASKENENLIDASMLNAMKHGAILINVARGSLIDEQALLSAVKEGRIGAAGLDVVRDEPLGMTNPLLALPQMVVTPHIAGFTDLMLQGTADYITKIVGQFAAGRKPESVLNKPGKPRRALAE